MSRCSSCGYNNEANVAICSKCKSPIVSTSFNNNQPLSNNGGGQVGGKATMKGANANMPAWDDAGGGGSSTPQPTIRKSKKCPSCSYDLMLDATECPNCDWVEAGGAKTPISKDVKDPELIVQKQSASPSTAGTVKIGHFNPVGGVKKFSLTDSTSYQKHIFEGEVTEINRANLDPSNNAISSKVHARFVHENGEWYIMDESTNQATFIQVKGKVALEKGAVVIIGNRVLTFDSE